MYVICVRDMCTCYVYVICVRVMCTCYVYVICVRDMYVVVGSYVVQTLVA